MPLGNYRIESKAEVMGYLSTLYRVLDKGDPISFQQLRNVDRQRDVKYTNQYTINKLFPNESPATVLRRELRSLTVSEYLRTVKDIRFPNRGEFREFGKVYSGEGDVYIKFRIELPDGSDPESRTTFVMSFHFAAFPLEQETFPYKE